MGLVFIYNRAAKIIEQLKYAENLLLQAQHEPSANEPSTSIKNLAGGPDIFQPEYLLICLAVLSKAAQVNKMMLY